MRALARAAASCKYESEEAGPELRPTDIERILAPGAWPRNWKATGGMIEPPALVTVRDWPPLLAIMPATWVPWPLESTPLIGKSIITRLDRSGWLVSTPESFTLIRI